jgi:hypothetical protein
MRQLPTPAALAAPRELVSGPGRPGATDVRGRPPIHAIGALAHAALLESRGVVEVLDGGRDTAYAMAAGEVIWIGHGRAALHPRAVVLERHVERFADAVFVVDRIAPWRAALPATIDAPARVRERAATLREQIVATASPRGLALLLRGDVPPFPLGRALPDVEALALACAHDDAEAACRAALPLLGLGPGLTPSGDDLVGAAFFARRALARRASDGARWARAGARLAQASGAHAHPIAAALLRDLVRGATFAPLHRLAAAVADGSDAPADAARELIAIGHSSGWDMLAGFLIGILGRVHASPLRAQRGDCEGKIAEPIDPLPA